jgi:hypothetical protein
VDVGQLSDGAGPENVLVAEVSDEIECVGVLEIAREMDFRAYFDKIAISEWKFPVGRKDHGKADVRPAGELESELFASWRKDRRIDDAAREQDSFAVTGSKFWRSIIVMKDLGRDTEEAEHEAQRNPAPDQELWIASGESKYKYQESSRKE